MEKLKLEDVKKELATKNALTLKEQTDVKGGWYSGKNPNASGTGGGTGGNMSGKNPNASGTGGGTSGNMRRPR